MQIQKPKADAAQTRHHSAINLQQPISIQEGKLILNVRFQIISLPLRARRRHRRMAGIGDIQNLWRSDLPPTPPYF
jgi:hypothetical protein